jgi:ribonuclease Y
MSIFWLILSIGLLGLMGFAGFVLYKRFAADQKVVAAEAKAKKLLEDATREAESKRREAIIEAKDEAIKLRREFENETRERRGELTTLEKRILQKEEHLDTRETGLEQREKDLVVKTEEMGRLKKKLDSVYQQQVEALEKVAALSKEDAKRLLLAHIEREIKGEAAVLIKEVEEQTKKVAQKRAREIIAMAIQRTAIDQVTDGHVSCSTA